MILWIAHPNVTFQNAWARDPCRVRDCQKRDRAEGWEERRHARMLPLAARSEWVCHCATGSQLHCPGATKVSEGRGGDMRSPVQELRHEPPYATSIGGLSVSAETSAICSHSWLVLLSYISVWKAAKPSAAQWWQEMELLCFLGPCLCLLSGDFSQAQ